MSGLFLLGLAVLFSSGVALILKISSALDADEWQLFAVNYLICTAAVLAWGGWRVMDQNTPFLWGLGALVGVLYVASLWLFNKAIDAQGLALSATLMRLSSALPTLGSLLIFKEQVNSMQLLGILLAFISLPLASKEPLRFRKIWKNAPRGSLWGLVLFGAYGLTDFIFKIQAELAPLLDPRAFMAGIFGSAFLLTLPGLFRVRNWTGPTLVWGIFLGGSNMLATYFWIETLAVLPGTTAFPVLGIGVIAVTTLAGLIFWRETLRPENYLFLALSAAAILMINIG